jgi:hypothetical protein
LRTGILGYYFPFYRPPLTTGGAGGIDFHWTESNGFDRGVLEAGTATGWLGCLSLAMHDVM